MVLKPQCQENKGLKQHFALDPKKVRNSPLGNMYKEQKKGAEKYRVEVYNYTQVKYKCLQYLTSQN